MDTTRVPPLDWPVDLFRDIWAEELIEDLDNPFLEASDFAAAAKHTSPDGRIPSHNTFLAA
jgi:hypothetical protein